MAHAYASLYKIKCIGLRSLLSMDPGVVPICQYLNLLIIFLKIKKLIFLTKANMKEISLM